MNIAQIFVEDFLLAFLNIESLTSAAVNAWLLLEVKLKNTSKSTPIGWKQ